MQRQFDYALVVGHPGHELRVHHWVETRRPVVCVLTDGSGHHGVPRLDSTSRVLAAAGATPGGVYGWASDRDLYQALLAGKSEVFVALAQALLDELLEHDVRTVAGDAIEGFNPAHDVCRLLLQAIVERARRAHGRTIENLAFALDAPPDEQPARAHLALELELDDAALERKLAAAAAYPEMAGEVALARERFGLAAFRHELLWAAPPIDLEERFPEPPFFEVHGERRVREGHYTEAIRLRQHLLPLWRALGGWSRA